MPDPGAAERKEKHAGNNGARKRAQRVMDQEVAYDVAAGVDGEKSRGKPPGPAAARE
jgi:hypothetical protein